MKNLLVGLIIIVIGSGLIYFRKPFVDICVGYQIWAFHMPFGRRTLQLNYILVPIFGAIVIIVGILTVIGVLKVK